MLVSCSLEMIERGCYGYGKNTQDFFHWSLFPKLQYKFNNNNNNNNNNNKYNPFFNEVERFLTIIDSFFNSCLAVDSKFSKKFPNFGTRYSEIITEMNGQVYIIHC